MNPEGLQFTLVFTGALLVIVNFFILFITAITKQKEQSQIPLILLFIHLGLVGVGILLDTDHYGWDNLGYGVLIMLGVGSVLLNGLFVFIYRLIMKRRK